MIKQMPIDTEGWIEVSRWDESELQEDHAWSALLNIGAYIDVVDEVTEILFGYSKRILRGEFHIDAIAKDRGIPRNASKHVKADVDQIQRFEKEHGPGNFFGYTHIYFHEIKQTNWQHYGIAQKDSDWFALFSLLNKLLEDHRFQSPKIRLVVWFNW
jgi:hypothetical protein